MARQGNVDTSIYLTNFKGINNLEDDKNIRNDELSDAVNFDVTRDGRLKIRTGFQKLRECTDGHSLFSDNVFQFFIDEDNLYKRNSNEQEEIIDIGYKGLKTSFIKYQNSILISNDNFIKKYKNNKIYNISPEKFQNSFSTSLFPNGGFPKGYYLISCCWVYDDGTEGGTTSPLQVNLTEDNFGINIFNFPINYDPNVSKIRVYMSFLNGSSLKFYGDYDISLNTIELRYNLSLGKDLETFNLEPLKAGSLMEQYKSVIFTAKDNFIYMSEPLTLLTSGRYYEFDGEIKLLLSVKDGLYVSDEYNVYFLSGNDPHNLDRTLIYNSPAIKYTHSKNIMTNEVFFFTQMGQIVGDQNGGIQNITEKMYLPEKELLEGATFIRYHEGVRQIITSFKGGENVNAGIGVSMNAEIIRKN